MNKKVKKYYWLKLDRNFLKRHDMKIIKAMPNGKDYIIFYLHLLLESIDHIGELRFSDTIPYDENMLSIITDTNIDIVRASIKIFKQLDLMQIWDDRTIYMTETQKMLGYETDYAKKKREYRKKLATTETLQIEESVEIKEIEKPKPVTKRFVVPNQQEVEAYCKERKNTINAESFISFYESKGWLIGANKMKDWKAAIRTWENKRKETQAGKKEVKKPEWYGQYTENFDKKYTKEELEKENEEVKKIAEELFK